MFGCGTLYVVDFKHGGYNEILDAIKYSKQQQSALKKP